MNEQKQHTFKIVATGPESSGKTTLTKSLAAHYGTVSAPEFARFYLAAKQERYTREDLSIIGQGQRAWENWYGQHASRLLFCDTDWTVLQIWEQFRFGPPPSGVWAWQDAMPQTTAQLYLLCAPDFPWQPDPLREDPETRGELFLLYEKLLTDLHLPFLMVQGAQEARLEIAISAINKFFRPL